MDSEARHGTSVAGAARRRDEPLWGGPAPLSVLTLVLWAFLLAVGLVGMWVQPPAPAPPASLAAPLQAEWLEVDLTPSPAPPEPAGQTAPAERPLAPPGLRPLAPIPALPETDRTALEALAWSPPANAAVADSATALLPSTGPAESAAGVGPAVAQRLEFGEGRGRQPAPVYPREARRERQEGSPGICFTVDSSGRVSDASVFQPSPWKLLDHAALEAVRRRWRFTPDDAGFYEVFIRFEMGR